MTAYAVQNAYAFLLSQTAHIETTAYMKKYARIQYPMLVPVSTEAPDWTRTITHFSTDGTGEAQWLSGRGADMPLADVSRAKYDVTAEMAGIGYDYSMEELSVAMAANMNLTTDKAVRARRASEELIEKVVLEGDSGRRWDSLINAPATQVARFTLADNSAGSSKNWVDKEIDEMNTDVNDLLTDIYEDTRQVEWADTLLLPIRAMTLLATRRIPNTSETFGSYLMRSNIYTLETGNPLMLKVCRELQGVGTGGSGRMVAYRMDPEVLKLHMPMPYMFGEVFQKGHQHWEVPGYMRTAGLEIRLPGAMRYADEITPA